MACPYFMPVAKLENGNWLHPSRLPLGCGWSGRCTAPGHENEAPSQDVLETFCNLGYASGCAWRPMQRNWDAVRFAVSAPIERSIGASAQALNGEAQARILRLIYVCEHEHHPIASGELAFDLSQASWLRSHDDARIQKMAECFLDSYLKKRS